MAEDIRESIEAEEEVIVITDEDGQEHEFTIAQIIRVDEKNYAILLPITDDFHRGDESEEPLILRVDLEDGEDALVDIEDEEEFVRVAAFWNALLNAEEDEEQ